VHFVLLHSWKLAFYLPCIERTIMLSQDVRPSVCLSVTRRYCVETAKHFLTLFSLSGNHTSLVFPHQTLWQWWGPRANGGVQCRGGYEKIAIILDQYKLSLYRGNDTRQDHKANRKPYPSFRMVPFSTTLSDI